MSDLSDSRQAAHEFDFFITFIVELCMPLVLIAIAMFSAEVLMAQSKILNGPGMALRRDALSAPLPAYPQNLLASKKGGIVVVEVHVSSDGHVIRLRRLEAFDEHAFHAVSQSVSGWTFKPLPADPIVKGAIRVSRLTFAFQVVDGKGVVVDYAAETLKQVEKTTK